MESLGFELFCGGGGSPEIIEGDSCNPDKVRDRGLPYTDTPKYFPRAS